MQFSRRFSRRSNSWWRCHATETLQGSRDWERNIRWSKNPRHLSARHQSQPRVDRSRMLPLIIVTMGSFVIFTKIILDFENPASADKHLYISEVGLFYLSQYFFLLNSVMTVFFYLKCFHWFTFYILVHLYIYMIYCFLLQ